MTAILEEDFNILYENDSTSNYLVLKTNIFKPAINYQIQMLLNNKLNGLLAFNVNYTENSFNCFYDVTSKCTLAGFLSRKRFSRDEFLKTILNIINNIYQMKSYLLYDSNIILDENFIYVEPEYAEIYFVYLPFVGYKNDFKAFFTKIIFKLVKFREEVSDNYIQKILELINDDNFNMADLKSLAEELIGEDIKDKALKLSSGVSENVGTLGTNNAKAHLFKIGKSEIGLNKKDKDKQNKAKESIFSSDKCEKDKTVLSKGNIKIPDSLNEHNQKNQKLSFKTTESKQAQIISNGGKLKNPKAFLPMILFLQVFILITFILAVQSDLAKMSDNPTNAKAILVFIFLCIDILAIRIAIEKKKSICVTYDCKALQKITDVMKVKTKLVTAGEEVTSKINSKEKTQLSVPDKIYSGATEIIKIPAMTNVPYLKEKYGEETVKINKKAILIGRMKNFVDFAIDNNAVGKIHAEILKEGEEVYVIDCNSRNGTFLNDNRIAPNTRNKVSNNDILRFANTEYIFYYKCDADVI